jgi:GTP cyclohydrolase IA
VRRRRDPADRKAAARAIEAFLRAVGAPAGDPELSGTAKRVADAWIDELLEGYGMNPEAVLQERTESSDTGLVVLCALETTTMCPHHLLPAAGIVHLGYVPAGSVVGIGALARLVDCFAHRLVLQEDLGRNVARALMEHAGAAGAACIVDLSQSCMTARGKRRHRARTVSFAWEGALARDRSLRAQMLAATSSRADERD